LEQGTVPHLCSKLLRKVNALYIKQLWPFQSGLSEKYTLVNRGVWKLGCRGSCFENVGCYAWVLNIQQT